MRLPVRRRSPSIGRIGPGEAGRGAAAEKPKAPAVLDVEQARNHTFQILSERDRFVRMRAVCELIPSITKDNWRGVLDAFSRQCRMEGRTFSEGADFHLVLEQIGKVAGEDAVNERLDASNPNAKEIASYVLTGWAEQDAKDAEAWFLNLPPEKRQPLLSRLVVGLARNDPRESLEFAFAQKVFQEWNSDATYLVAEAVQQSGFQVTEDLLRQVSAHPEIPDGQRGKMFGAVAETKVKMNAEAGTPMATLDWFQQYVGQTYIGPIATGTIISQAATSDPAQTESWLAQYGDRLTPVQRNSAVTTLARIWQQQSPDAFAGWLTGHPDDTQHDELAAAATMQQLSKGQFDQAQRWSSLINDPNTRAQWDQSIANSQKAKTQQAPGQ